MSVSRRTFLPAAAATVAASALAAPAIAQSDPTIKWRLTASYPKSLDTLFGAVNTIARVTSELTDGKFELQPFAAGEIVPGLQVLDAVSNGTVESGFTYMGYYIGKNPASIFDASLPFGLTPRMHQAWLMFGGGRQLMDELYDAFGVVAITAGNTAASLYSDGREQIAQQILEDVRRQVAPRGIVVENVLLRDLQLPESLKHAIEAKQQAQQEAQRMEFVLQREKQEAERKRVEAAGIKDFQDIVSQGISEKLLEWKGIEATMELVKSQNSKVIIVGNSKNGLPLIYSGEK